MAQSKIPWLQLPPRVFNTGSRSFVGASGLKIVGPGVVGAPLNIEVAGESLIPGKWRTTAGNGTSSLIAMPTGTAIYNQCLVNIAFHGNTNTQIVHSPTNAYVCWYHSLTLYGCGGGIGSGISRAPGTARADKETAAPTTRWGRPFRVSAPWQGAERRRRHPALSAPARSLTGMQLPTIDHDQLPPGVTLTRASATRSRSPRTRHGSAVTSRAPSAPCRESTRHDSCPPRPQPRRRRRAGRPGMQS